MGLSFVFGVGTITHYPRDGGRGLDGGTARALAGAGTRGRGCTGTNKHRVPSTAQRDQPPFAKERDVGEQHSIDGHGEDHAN